MFLLEKLLHRTAFMQLTSPIASPSARGAMQPEQSTAAPWVGWPTMAGWRPLIEACSLYLDPRHAAAARRNAGEEPPKFMDGLLQRQVAT